jgi:ParB-like nuclease domain
MTAAKTVAFDELADEGVKGIFLDDLLAAPWNARKTIDPGSLGELAASIRQHGIQVPLIVRRSPTENDYWEIVAGHRRFAAAQQLGLQTLAKQVDDYSLDIVFDWGGKSGKKIEELIAVAKAAELDALLFHSVFGRELHADYYERTQKDRGRGKLRELAKLAGVDAAAIEKKAEAALKSPEPKAEAKPAPKKAAKKAAKKGGRK